MARCGLSKLLSEVLRPQPETWYRMFEEVDLLRLETSLW